MPLRQLLLLLPLIVLFTASCATTGGGGSVVTGKASYYGPGFDGKATANGEKFDRRGLTAAHPSHPFGTLVRVTNIANGKSVDVRINDRFGGHRGRVIDLSEGAFRRIADVKAGVIDVRVEKI